jgi:hypothetical protein
MVMPEYSDGSGAYKIAFNASYTSPPATVTELAENVWIDGAIATGGEQWFKFTATAGTQYIHFSPGTLTEAYVQLYNSNGSIVGTGTSLPDNTNTYISRTVTVDDVYYIKVQPRFTNASGAYKIQFNASSAIQTPIELPDDEDVTTLTAADTWADGTIAANGEKWLKFTATAGTQYIHFDQSTSGNVYVQLYDSNGFTIGNTRNLNSGTPSLNQTLKIGGEYYIKVTPRLSSLSSTYKIAFNESATPPSSVTLPTEGVTALAANIWADGAIATDGAREQWFKFTATAAAQYLHFEPGTLSSVNVQLYTNIGITVGIRTNLSGSTLNTSPTVTSGNEYYIKVTPYSSSYSGAYRIAFNESATPPPSVTPPTEGVTALAANTWANGNIGATGEWFKFTAAAAAQYLHFEQVASRVNAVYVQVYDGNGSYVQLYQSNGAMVGLRASLGSAILNLKNLTANSEYYIKATQYDSRYSGAYKIAFSDSITPPPSFTPPPTGPVTTLTANVWSPGDIASDGEQWFEFTATAETQYIHFDPGTLTDVYVQLYDKNGSMVNAQSSLWDNAHSIDRTVTNGEKYYLKIMPSSNNSGTFSIAFNASSTPPPITLPNSGVTQISAAHAWVDGNIATIGGEQWFKFTATAETQYIHFGKVGIMAAYIYLYDSDGASVGSLRTYGISPFYTFQTVTQGQAYYIKIMPFATGTGAYKIAFNTSTTAPSSP